MNELRADERRDLNGVLITIDGGIVAEAYFNGEGPDTLHDIRSAGKSITSLVVGIAIDRGLVPGVQAGLTTLLPEPPAPDKARITLEDVLTMRSGLEADDDDPKSPGNEDLMDRAPDWLTFALRVPMREEPGALVANASVNAFLAGAVVERASGSPLDEFATHRSLRAARHHEDRMEAGAQQPDGRTGQSANDAARHGTHRRAGPAGGRSERSTRTECGLDPAQSRRGRPDRCSRSVR